MMLSETSFLPVSAGHGEVARCRRDGGALRALPLHHAAHGPARGRSIPRIDLELLGAIQPNAPHAFGTGRKII